MADFNYKLSQSYLDAWRAGRAASVEKSKDSAGAYDFAYTEIEKILNEKNIPGALDVFIKFYNKETGQADSGISYLTQTSNWNAIVADNPELIKLADLIKDSRASKQINYESKSDIKYEIDGPEYQFQQSYLETLDSVKRYQKDLSKIVKIIKDNPEIPVLLEYIDPPKYLKIIDFQNEFVKAYDWFKEQEKLASANILEAQIANETEPGVVPTSQDILNTESGKISLTSTLNVKSKEIPSTVKEVLELDSTTKSPESSEEIVKGNVLPAESAPSKTTESNTTVITNNLNNTKESQTSNNSSEKIVNGASEIIKSETSKSEKSSESNNTSSSEVETNSAEQQYIQLQKELANLTLDEDSTIFKSNKLADSGAIKKMLSPDKTLELSVGELSKTLPEAVNNLTSSVTSIAPQTSSSNTINNEGTKIDQSSNTQINQTPSQIAKNQEMDQAKVENSTNSQLTEHYMQAIYQALVSGKVKVRMDY